MKFEVGKNAKRNMVVGFANKIVLMILPFVIRSIINMTLGAEYLGLNSLFSSVIQVLSLTELGFSSALVYHMYKPIAMNDTVRINALLNLYKKAYRIIGIVVLFVGLMITPFISKLIRGSYPTDVNIYILFVVYVINTSISYWLFGYRQSLLVAYQREDLNAFINLMVQLCLYSCQIVLLLLYQNYYFYIICLPVFTIINNVWVLFITKRIFPWAKPIGKLDKSTLNDIKRLVTGTFISKACQTTRNSLDSICISAFLGLTLTGIYNNYYVIFNGVTTVLGIVSVSLSGGIGNHVAIKSMEDNFEELKKLDFIYTTVSGVCTACLLCLYQPFMKIWMGEDMLLPISSVVILCFYFYLLKMGDMRSLYSAANGLWWKMKWRSICETVVNVALNIILGKILGVNGIILATIVSIFLCNFVWSSFILFDDYFSRKRIHEYFNYHFKYAVVTIFICTINYCITNILFQIENQIIDLVTKAIIVVGVSFVLYFLIYFRTNIFKQSMEIIKR